MPQEPITTLIDEIIAEDTEIILELIKEEVQPIIDAMVKEEKKAFNKAYSEYEELRQEDRL